MLVDVALEEAPILIPIEKKKEMMSVRVEGSKTFVRINSSSLSIIQECKRKALYSLKEEWATENESPATLFGSAIHKALEVFYSGDPAERKLPLLEHMELMSYGHQVPGEESDLLLRATRAFVEKAKPLAALPETDKRSIQNGVYTLWHYFKAYLDDPFVAYVDEQGPFVERNCSFVLFDTPELQIEYFGTIDLVMQHTQTKEIVVCDHKTSSVVGTEFYNRLKPNHQYTGYLMGVRRQFGLDVNSFMVNCIQVKEKPKTSRGTPPNFPRQITTRDAMDFMEFEGAVVWAVREYLRGSWPIGQTNACATYGGCKYLAVCAAPESMRKGILQSKFTQPKQETVWQS
jgi:hypothetical protein